MLMMNWRMRNIPDALDRPTTIRPSLVSTNPTLETITYRGTIVAGNGTIIVESMIQNIAFLPRNRYFANPIPAMVQVITLTTLGITDVMMLFA